MGIHGGIRDTDSRTITTVGQGEIVELADGNTIRKAVYRTGGGLQIGCTFVTGEAMRKLISIWEDRAA